MITNRRNLPAAELCLVWASAFAALFLLATQSAMADGKVFNVKKPPFNAVGNGVTDDSAAIQQAADAAAAFPGSTVYFPKGSYLHNSTIFVNGQRTKLQGEGRKSTTVFGGQPIVMQGSGSSAVNLSLNSNKLILQSINGFHLSNCTIVFAGPSALDIENSNNISVANCLINSDSRAILGQNSTNITIRDSQISCPPDVNTTHLINTNKVLVERCQFSGGVSRYESTQNVTFRGNSYFGRSDFQNSAAPAVRFDVVNNLLVRGNRFSNCAFPVVVVLSSNVQILENRMTNQKTGILANQIGTIESSKFLNIRDNRIDQCLGNGITVNAGGTGSLAIERNRSTNCGLTSATAVILVDDGTTYSPAFIRENRYSGNEQNISYFIRCFIPSPPAVVSGNRTSTTLPTLVGP